MVHHASSVTRQENGLEVKSRSETQVSFQHPIPQVTNTFLMCGMIDSCCKQQHRDSESQVGYDPSGRHSNIKAHKALIDVRIRQNITLVFSRTTIKPTVDDEKWTTSSDLTKRF
ncbi:hypothetical protein H2248_008134 [Termitomyces sp. 'cryptogamus']|nr:hypothetical protein H2248_008134 [Termitomyces sp. 'cryptogamus']